MIMSNIFVMKRLAWWLMSLGMNNMLYMFRKI